MGVVGITGTDGKTTTAYLVRAMLEACGLATGMLGTIDVVAGGRSLGNPGRATTPEAPELQGHLRQMVDAGDRWAVVESTSHGLAQERVGEVAYDVAVHTNVTHEHLEFHRTPEAYRAAKRRLFERLAVGPSNPDKGYGKHAVVNLDDPHADLFVTAAAEAGATLHGYGVDPDGASTIRAMSVREGAGLSLMVRTPRWQDEVRVQLAGRFNVHNALAAIGVGEALDLDPAAMRRGIGSLERVPGRMETVDLGQPFLVVVDYAHTPEALAKALDALSPQALAAGGRLICVFGSAGDRDVAKRPMMGRVAGERCRLVVVTDEDPRSEDRSAILDAIAQRRRACRSSPRPGPAAHPRPGRGHRCRPSRRRDRGTSSCWPGRATSEASRWRTVRCPGTRPAPPAPPLEGWAITATGRLPAMDEARTDAGGRRPGRSGAAGGDDRRARRHLGRAGLSLTPRRGAPVGGVGRGEGGSGWAARRIRIDDDAGPAAVVAIQERDLAAPIVRRTPAAIRDTVRDVGGSLGRFLYAPLGPVLLRDDPAAITAALRGMRTIARQRHAALLVIDPCWEVGGAEAAALVTAGFTAARRPVQVSTTGMFVPLHADEAAQWRQLNQNARRNVDKCRKAGVEVVRFDRTTDSGDAVRRPRPVVRDALRDGRAAWLRGRAATGGLSQPRPAAAHRVRQRLALGRQPGGPGARAYARPSLGRPGGPVRGGRGGPGRRPPCPPRLVRAHLSRSGCSGATVRGQLPAPVDHHPLGRRVRLHDL